MTTQPSVNDMKCVLTSKGYAIRKDRLTTQEQQKIRTELTVAPKAMKKGAPTGKPFAVYYESALATLAARIAIEDEMEELVNEPNCHEE